MEKILQFVYPGNQVVLGMIHNLAYVFSFAKVVEGDGQEREMCSILQYSPVGGLQQVEEVRGNL